jgi:HNH endonuclease
VRWSAVSVIPASYAFSAMTAHRCIWCTLEKPEDDFNVEHVLPQSFGTFEQSLTLVNKVCKACNDFFANNLEPWLARDSLEGFDRYRCGQKPTSEFKSLGKRSTTRVQIPDGPYAGAWGFNLPGKELLEVRPFPQVGFAKSADGPFEWYLLDELPTLDDLKTKGYAGECHMRLCECDDTEAVTLLLQQKGINYSAKESFVPPSGPAWMEQVFRPTVNHRRALAKIAMNYLAHEYGRGVALEPRFDAIRDLVMRGLEPDYRYYSIDENPIIEGDKQDGKRYLMHVLAVSPRKDGIEVEGMVSLYNRFRHGIRLSVKPGSPIEPRGHIFDIDNRVIRPVPSTAMSAPEAPSHR